jgi:hypothetical protein
VHHFGRASFGKLAAAGEFGSLFHLNRAKWESKWNCQWQPHSRRGNAAYDTEVQNVRRTIEEHVPPTAKLLVVTKGDDELLELADRDAAHFPQQADGTYAGHNPADGSAAVAQLAALCQRGSQYFVLPKGSFWWLNFYVELRKYLSETSEVVQQNADAVIYRLH